VFRLLLLLGGLFAATIAAMPAPNGAPTPLPSPVITASGDAVTHHTITLGAKAFAYTARAGVITLRDEREAPTATIFYTAYTLDGGGPNRPVTFFYNGGPGSSTMWLHMGSFAPVRVVTANGSLTGPPPYRVVPNDKTLLDVTDMVFIDMPDTGFGRITASPKTFFGLDADVTAFAQFITRYITTFNRWNSPRFLYGESYGTTRSAALVDRLQRQGVSFNGVVLQSTILNFGLDDLTGAEESGFPLYLPSEAATAWYHHALPGSYPSLDALVNEVESFALGEYSDALAKGDTVPSSEFNDVAAKLHRYTGMPEEYIRSANLRVPYWQFENVLYRNQGQIVGRLDSRFQTGTLDRYQGFPRWDPTDAAIDGAFTTAINEYLRDDLAYQTPLLYKTSAGMDIRAAGGWDFKHRGNTQPDVTPDLAEAMTYNPSLKIFSANGYYDFATPFFETVFSLRHLGIDPSLQNNITYGFYQSGHMIYLDPGALGQLHDDLERWYAGVLGGR
jgi:carboxypeptidase C (cathepsin A)